MKLLESYLKLKDISYVEITEGTGLGYHCVQKTIRGLRSGRIPRQMIADFLGLHYDQIWGSSAARNLRKLINSEFRKAS